MSEIQIVLLKKNAANSKAQVAFLSPAPAAGFPMPGDDVVEESLNIHDFLVENPDSTFFVRVEGDSMEGSGIFSGDILAVDRSVEVKNGQIVLAAVSGGLVVKKLARYGDSFVLMSENVDYPPIHITGDDECFIWGVVIGSVRKF